VHRPSIDRVARAGLAAVAVLLLAACGSRQSGPASLASTVPSSSTSRATHAVHTASPKPTTTSGFDRTAHSLDDPSSIWVVVDKQRPLQPRNYVPSDLVTPAVPHTNVPRLRRVASDALLAMFADAKEDGITLYSLSAYRSYTTQASLFDRNMRRLGADETLELTARPGYSEHQTGLADDLGDHSACDLAVCFESHPAAKWLAANSWRYGWILRYPLGYTTITGIQTEPWHFRYIGEPAAKQMHTTGVKTLEQFFDLPDSPDY
jgi:D-alanyl-D-alanine carboxypeptidase